MFKKYQYNDTGLLSFTWAEKDYVVFGSGPHELPTSCPIVVSLSKQGILTEENQRTNKIKNK